MSSFSHLVEINDLLNPLLDTLTREQLWSGLVRRAEDPAQFVIGLDSCRIVGRDGESLLRELQFGSLVVRDRVSFAPLQSVRYDVEAGENFPASTLVMRIEEPQPEHLFVHFEYSDQRPEPRGEDFEALRVLHSAYKAADIDTIRGIRRLIAEGSLA
jgi:hypothetical protein